jgi:hypothetical protein
MIGLCRPLVENPVAYLASLDRHGLATRKMSIKPDFVNGRTEPWPISSIASNVLGSSSRNIIILSIELSPLKPAVRIRQMFKSDYFLYLLVAPTSLYTPPTSSIS